MKANTMSVDIHFAQKPAVLRKGSNADVSISLYSAADSEPAHPGGAL